VADLSPWAGLNRPQIVNGCKQLGSPVQEGSLGLISEGAFQLLREPT